mgnify:CR=1 FL=1
MSGATPSSRNAGSTHRPSGIMRLTASLAAIRSALPFASRRSRSASLRRRAPAGMPARCASPRTGSARWTAELPSPQRSAARDTALRARSMDEPPDTATARRSRNSPGVRSEGVDRTTSLLFQARAAKRSAPPANRHASPGVVATSVPNVSNPRAMPKRIPTAGIARTILAVAMGPESATEASRLACASALNETAKSMSACASGAPDSVATIHAAANPRQAGSSDAGQEAPGRFDRADETRASDAASTASRIASRSGTPGRHGTRPARCSRPNFAPWNPAPSPQVRRGNPTPQSARCRLREARRAVRPRRTPRRGSPSRARP